MKSSAKAKLGARSNFAIAHIKIAERAAEKAEKVEAKHAGSGHGSWFNEIMMHVPVAIVMSAAAVESMVNEWSQDVLDDKARFEVSESKELLIKKLTVDKRCSALERFEKLCLYLGHVPKKEIEWQNVQYVSEFRNHFMHFRPSWDDSDLQNNKLVEHLKRRKIPTYEPYKDSGLILPYGFMTSGCARWAVESAKKFAKRYSFAHGFSDKLR